MEQKDVYICYNGEDLEWVKRLAEQIESETIDGSESSRHLTSFFDKWDISPGHPCGKREGDQNQDREQAHYA